MATESRGSEHITLRTLAKQAENVERVVISLENQIARFTEDGWPAVALAWSSEQVPALRKVRSQLMQELQRTMSGTPLGEWQVSTVGIGSAIFFLLGLMPPLEEFRQPAAVWKYVGLHVSGGHAIRRRAGVNPGFNTRLRAYAIKRVADPCMKHRASPYRPVYDSRRERSVETHPPMLPQGHGCDFCDLAYAKTASFRAEKNLGRERTAVGFDCSAAGGIHWSDGHRHADALRVTAKAILLDAWKVARGKHPVRGVEEGHREGDIRQSSATFAPLA